jgi:sugar lactone lactonase YvrE
MLSLRVLAPVLCVFVPLWAVETQVWEHSGQADFEKGALRKLSLSSDGRLTPAPVVREIYDPSVAFLWAVARDSKGNVYAGGGGVGGSTSKLIVVDPAGKAKTLAELDGMVIQAIAIDKQDRVYAGTSPDGKVYRVDAAGKSQVFYDPKTKYIWALAFASNGDLFVATGDDGEIHRVTPNGAGSVFYRTEEAHVRSLAIDAKDNVIAGTDPSGLILRVSPSGEGFVLYEAAKREVTTVAVAADGAIYAAATGTKAIATAPAPAAPARQVQTSQGTITLAVPTGGPGRGGAAPAPATGGGAPLGVQGGSEIYRVQPDGYARRIWTHAQDVVYALAFDAQGKLIAGTGNRGNIYRLESDDSDTRLLNLAPAQVTGFTMGSNGRLYAVTGNIGEIFSIGPEREASGTLESEVLDAGAFAYWGRMTSSFAGSGGVSFETRSGNVSRAQKDWSPWAKLNGDRVPSPAARFLQYRATVTGSAELYDITAAYEMKNVPPVIEAVEATPANYKFPAPAASSASSPPSLSLPPLGRSTATPAPSRNAADSGTSPALTFAKGYIGARWLANDENGDTLVFKIEIRGENETTWKPLRENLRERYYSWDSTAFPDGKYRVRVTASDAPSNTPSQTLTSSRESEPFLIDNTPPEITGLTVLSSISTAGGVSSTINEVRFHAKDALNVLSKAEYSVNGGEWKIVEPTTRLTDSQEHDYRVPIIRVPGETTIAVRVTDAYDNEAVAKTLVK